MERRPRYEGRFVKRRKRTYDDFFPRRKKRRNRMVTVPRNKLAFPQTMKTKLRYVERVDFVPTGTSAHQY